MWKKAVNISALVSLFLLIGICVSGVSLYMLSHSLLGVSGTDRRFMSLAYDEAQKALQHDDAPVGAVMVADDEIVSKAHNEVRAKNDHKKHAEMTAIDDALGKLGLYDFRKSEQDIVLYTTYEPCPMCEGYIIRKGVPRVVVGLRKSLKRLLRENVWGHIAYRFSLRGGIEKQQQLEIYKDYDETAAGDRKDQ